MTKKNKEDQELTDKEYAFVMEYLKDYNGARAARACGYNSNNPQNARGTACEILAKPHIEKFIKQHKADLRQECDIDKELLLNILKQIATADVTDYIDPDTLEGIKDLENLPNSKAIQEINYFRQVNDEGEDRITTKIKLGDRIKAIDLIAKILGLDETDETEDLSIEVTVTHLAPQNNSNTAVIESEETVEAVVEFDESEVTTPDISIKINKK